jgi:hypothetical protein
VSAPGLGQVLGTGDTLKSQIVTHSVRGTPRVRATAACMHGIQRRTFVGATVSLAALLLSPGRAQATLMRGLPLRDLVARSQHVVLLTALESRCIYAEIGGQHAIITEPRARVEEVIAKLSPSASEIVVRTLGGQLDGVGELVHGQAEFSRNAPCVGFLCAGSDSSLWVTGMAQGHYPVDGAAGEPRLAASPHLPSIRDWEHCAVRTLVGRNLADARELVRKANVQ